MTNEQHARLILAGKHLAVKLADCYRAAGVSVSNCDAIKEWLAACEESVGKVKS